MDSIERGLVQVEEDAYRLRVSWNNWKIRRVAIMTIFALFSAILTLITLVLATRLFKPGGPGGFLTVCHIFAWAGTLLIFVQNIWRFFSSEWIELDASAISWGVTGPLAGKGKRVLLTSVTELCLGERHDSDGEFASTAKLNVYETRKVLGYNLRRTLAYWLGKKEIEFIFERFRAFVADRGLPLKMTRYARD